MSDIFREFAECVQAGEAPDGSRAAGLVERWRNHITENYYECTCLLYTSDQTSYMSGKETKLQMQFVEAVNGASRVSGTPVNDCGPSAFKTSIESEIQSVSNGTITVDEFLSKIGEARK